MTRAGIAAVTAAVALLGTAAPATAQARLPTDSTQLVEVRLRDGSVLYGRVTAADTTRVTLRTPAGARVDVARAEVERVRPVTSRDRDGRFRVEDPNRTRLLFTSTARPLARGEGYVADYLFVLPFAAYGVTDRLSIAGGTPLIPGVIGRVWYAAPKLTVAQSSSAAVAVGALGFVDAREAREGSVGVLYGVTTLGSSDHALTLGAGWGYATAGSRSGISNDPVLVLGGETRVARRLKLLTENWLFPGDDGVGGVVSGGVRFIGDRLSADLGLMGYRDGRDGACCLPAVNFVWMFGGR